MNKSTQKIFEIKIFVWPNQNYYIKFKYYRFEKI